MAIAKGKDRQASVDHELFISRYVETGDAQLAAKEAGASNPEYGYRLLKLKAEEVRKATLDRINSSAPQAIKVLQEIMLDPEAGAQARIAAASKIASYAGLDIQRSEDVTPRDNRTDEEIRQAMIEQVRNMPADIKLQLRQALGENPENVAVFPKATESTESNAKQVANSK